MIVPMNIRPFHPLLQLIILLVLAIGVWVVIACLLSYPVMSVALLWYRNEGATRLRLASIDLPGTGVRSRLVPFEVSAHRNSLVKRSVKSPRYFLKHSPQQRYQQQPELTRYQIPGENVESADETSPYEDSVPAQIDPWSKLEPDSTTFRGMTRDHEADRYDPTGIKQTVTEALQNVENQIHSSETDLVKNISDMSISSADEFANRAATVSQDYGQRIVNKALSASESVSMFFKCSADSIDLSYYGKQNDRKHTITMKYRFLDLLITR